MIAVGFFKLTAFFISFRTKSKQHHIIYSKIHFESIFSIFATYFCIFLALTIILYYLCSKIRDDLTARLQIQKYKIQLNECVN